MPYCRIRGNCFYASFVARAVSLTFGKRLRAALDRKGLTAGHIAAIGEISRTAVYDYLNDKRNPEPPQCRIIAAVLGLPETEVLDRGPLCARYAVELDDDAAPRAHGDMSRVAREAV